MTRPTRYRKLSTWQLVEALSDQAHQRVEAIRHSQAIILDARAQEAEQLRTRNREIIALIEQDGAPVALVAGLIGVSADQIHGILRQAKTHKETT